MEKQSIENRNNTVKAQLDLYSKCLLNVLNRVDSKDDVLKNILALINDLLLDVPEFLDAVLKLSEVDKSLPYIPFINHLDNKDNLIKSLSLYNLEILLGKVKTINDDEILIKIFSVLSYLIGESADSNYQFIGVQLLQDLLIVKPFKLVYQNNNLLTNFKPINNLIEKLAKNPNSIGLQLSYNVLLVVWVLSYTAPINRSLIHNFPQLVGNLLSIAKDSIKLKIVRVAVAILKNFVDITISSQEQFKVIKVLLFSDALNTVNTLKERKFASNGSDEELSNDLNYLYDNLQEIVTQKLTSFDEYLTELENPKLISWASPTHKSTEFWLENSGKFKDSNYKLVKRILKS